MAKPRCAVCGHPEKEAIERDTIDGGSPTAIARKYSLTSQQVYDHKNRHLPKILAALKDQPKMLAQATTLLDKLGGLEADARRMIKLAEESGDIKVALQGLREVVRVCELFAKVTGELQTGKTEVNVNVNIGPLPEIGELVQRFAQLDTPEAAARRKWIAEGGPLPKALVGNILPSNIIEGELISDS